MHGAAMIPETSPIANAPARPAPPTPLEPRLPRRRELQLERAEHRGRHRGEHERDEPDHPRVLHHAAEGLPGERRPDAERRVHRGDAEDVQAGEQRSPRGAAAGLAGAEDRDGDGDERVDAGGEARRDAARRRRPRRRGPSPRRGGRRAADRSTPRSSPSESEVREVGDPREGERRDQESVRRATSLEFS